MTTHQVKYEGPAALAVRVATLLADAHGIDLKSAEKQEDPGRSVGTVLLALTVEGTTEEVAAAVGAIRDGLPAGASITVQPRSAPR